MKVMGIARFIICNERSDDNIDLLQALTRAHTSTSFVLVLVIRKELFFGITLRLTCAFSTLRKHGTALEQTYYTAKATILHKFHMSRPAPSSLRQPECSSRCSARISIGLQILDPAIATVTPTSAFAVCRSCTSRVAARM